MIKIGDVIEVAVHGKENNWSIRTVLYIHHSKHPVTNLPVTFYIVENTDGVPCSYKEAHVRAYRPLELEDVL